MPVEGQWRRVHTPLGQRERRVLAVAGVAAALAVGGGVYYAASGSSEQSDVGCVVVTVPASLGGERLRRCGSDADAFCHAEGLRNETVAAACRRKGFATTP
jgi:hypothetical protein